MKTKMGLWGVGLAGLLAFAVATPAVAGKRPARSTESAEATGDTQNLSKEDQAKLREHIKLRNRIMKGVKYPASKEDIVRASNKSWSDIKADDKKWFQETLPDKTFNSSDEVMKALGWPVDEPEHKEGK